MIYCILSSNSCSILHVFLFCFGICSNGYVVIFMHRMTFKDIRKHTFLDIKAVLEFFPNYNRTLQAWCDDIVACHIRFIDLLNLLFVNGEDKNFKSMKYNKKLLIFFLVCQHIIYCKTGFCFILRCMIWLWTLCVACVLNLKMS